MSHSPSPVKARSKSPAGSHSPRSASRSPSRSRSPGRRGGGSSSASGDNKRIYVGKISHRTRERDLEDVFGKFGRIQQIDLKDGYGFVEFEDSSSATDAIADLDGTDLDGSIIKVEASHRGEGRCFNCGKEGHWARDCRDGGRNRGFGRGGGGSRGGSGPRGGGGCFNCGEFGHMARDCREPPRNRGGPPRGRYDPYPPRGGGGYGGYNGSGGGGGGGGGYRRRSRSRSISPRRRRSPSPRR